MSESPFHEGEIAVQARAGETFMAERNGVIIADRIMSGAVRSLQQQSFAVLASRARDGSLWASLLFGAPGFLETGADRHTLAVLLDRVAKDPHDPLWQNLAASEQAGMVVIDFATRQRLRINGRIALFSPERLVLTVAETYGNCPKYIQRRVIEVLGPGPATPRTVEHTRGRQLPPALTALIEQADTFFIASAHPSRGLDASHRGGYPGFVRVLDDHTLEVPDYPGNSMFNTLGNLAVDARAGLLFPDFEHARTLQMSGTTEIVWNSTSPAAADTHRAWRFHIEQWREAPMPVALRSRFLDYSPFAPPPQTR